ncbi:unnamed protein product [Amoebophrya sp. A25]|nr:unnamed protein product [Amoebophrya sp. A25]|eukprot:GSA25T00025224001.1
MLRILKQEVLTLPLLISLGPSSSWTVLEVLAQKVATPGSLDGIYRIFGHSSGLYLGRSGSLVPRGKENGASTHSDWSQEWIVRRAEKDDTYTLQQVSSGLFLDHDGGKTVVRPPTLGASQRWFLRLRRIAEGLPLSYELRQESSGKTLLALNSGRLELDEADAELPSGAGSSTKTKTTPYATGSSTGSTRSPTSTMRVPSEREWGFEKLRDLEVLSGVYHIKQKRTGLALAQQDLVPKEEATTAISTSGNAASGVVQQGEAEGGISASPATPSSRSPSSFSSLLTVAPLDMVGDSQRWEFSLVQGSIYTIDQWGSGKYLDAEVGEREQLQQRPQKQINTLQEQATMLQELPRQQQSTMPAGLSLAEGGLSQLWYLQPLQRNSGGSSD